MQSASRAWDAAHPAFSVSGVGGIAAVPAAQSCSAQSDADRLAVQDAARSPPGSKLFTFALSSLQHCREALRAWPHYCAHLLQVPVCAAVHVAGSLC